MELLKQKLIVARAAVSGMTPRTRMFAIASVLLVLAGVAWIIVSVAGSGQMVAISSSMQRTQLQQARHVLASAGMDYEIHKGVIWVHDADRDGGRKLLAGMQSAGDGATASGASGFEQLAGESGLWRTNSQNQRRWQARKMSELGSLIAAMEPVKAAAVLFEPGQRGGLGQRKSASTAAVKVTLHNSRPISPQLLVAIADLVSGSIASLKCDDVRIVDNLGNSYSVDASVRGAAAVARREQAMRGRLQDLLSDIPAVRIMVQFGVGRGKAARAIVSVPSNYLRDTSRSAKDNRKAAAAKLASIRLRVSHLLGSRDVTVTEYQTRPGSGVADSAGAGSIKASIPGWGVPVITALVGAVLAALAAVCVSRRRGGASVAGEALTGPVDKAISDSANSTNSSHRSVVSGQLRFGFLDAVNAAAIGELLAGERPGTMAAVLHHLPASKRYDVLAGIDGSIRRSVLDSLETSAQIPAAVLDGIEAELAAKVALDASVSRSEFHADKSATGSEDCVLAFEDIVRMSADTLAGALAVVDIDDLAIAMRTAARGIKKRVLASMSSLAAKRLKNRMERLEPVRLSEVETAQQRVLDAIRNARQERWISESRQAVERVEVAQ